MGRLRYATGAPWEARVGYARAVRTGTRVVVTGTTGLRRDGSYAEDAGGQARTALATIAEALEALGSHVGEVVRTRMFVTNIQADHEAVGEAHREVFGKVRPATTMVEVRALIADWMKVEIEAESEVGSAEPVLDIPRGRLRPASPEELGSVHELLGLVGLPIPDAKDRPIEAHLYEDSAGRVIGTVSFERSPEGVLLRSLAVHPEARGAGHGRALVVRALHLLDREKVPAVWLLTLLPPGFFEGLGFSPTTREAVPEKVRASREFAIHACDQARVLTRWLRSGG